MKYIIEEDRSQAVSKEIESIAPRSWRDPDSHFFVAMTHPWYKLLFNLYAVINHATHNFYIERGMQPTLLPITTGSISSPMGLGSDSLPVLVNIGGKPTYLADSMQFMLEYALRIQNKGVYYIMPSFRGEDSDSRHLCQFYHSEAEIVGDLSDVMKLVEEYVKYLVTAILAVAENLGLQKNKLNHLESFMACKNIPKLRYEEALKILNNNKRYVDFNKAGFTAIKSAGEQRLIKEFGGQVWLTHFPQLAVPFYQADEPGSEFSQCADLLIGIGETVGCGQRHEKADETLAALQKRKVDAESYKWYVQMREHAPLKTSGFGLGIERFILWVLKHNDIRDCQILPRFNGTEFNP